MGVLAGLIALAAAALPVIEESAVTLRPLLLVGPSFETYSVVSVPPPIRPPEHSHYRLRVNSPRVWIDGARLSPNEEGDFDLLNLHPRRVSRITLSGWQKEATVIETPRVFFIRHEIAEQTKLWVRNSLENTVNVYVTVTSSNKEEASASATIPPGVTQILTLEGALRSTEPPWRILLEKQEEAMEGGYVFVKTVDRRIGPTVNTYGKP